jgi:hypothetical protein
MVSFLCGADLAKRHQAGLGVVSSQMLDRFPSGTLRRDVAPLDLEVLNSLLDFTCLYLQVHSRRKLSTSRPQESNLKIQGGNYLFDLVRFLCLPGVADVLRGP